MQIMFVAIIIGISMILLGEKTDRVAGLAEQLSYVVQGIMGFIGRLVPFFVFGSLFNIIAGSDLEVLSGSGKYVLFALISVLAAMLLHIVLGSLKLRISPAAIWKKSAATFLIGLTTASSSAAFSSNLKACIKNYGVAERLANFGVPFGQILYKPDVAIIFWLTAVSVAEQAGLEVSLSWLVTAALMCIILSVATPPIAGGMMASFSVLFTQLGLPMDSLAVILAINILLDFVLTSTCLLSCQVVLASAARGLGMVDETLLRK